MRPFCKCGLRPRAVNYRKNNKIYYRSLCEVCLSHGVNHGIPRWYRAGYRMKSQCEKCGFIHSKSSDLPEIDLAGKNLPFKEWGKKITAHTSVATHLPTDYSD